MSYVNSILVVIYTIAMLAAAQQPNTVLQANGGFNWVNPGANTQLGQGKNLVNSALLNGANGPAGNAFANPSNGFNAGGMIMNGGGPGFAMPSAMLQANGALLNQMFQQCRGVMCQSTTTGIKYYSCDLMFFGAYNGIQCGPNAVPVSDCVGVTCLDAAGSTYNSCTLRERGYDGWTCAPGSFAQAPQRRPVASTGQCEGITCVNVLTGMEQTYLSCDLITFGFDGKSCGAGYRPKGSCGADNYNAQCAAGYCCSGQGYCGQDDNYCNAQSRNASSGFPYNNGGTTLNALQSNALYGQNSNGMMSPSNGYNSRQNGVLYGSNAMPTWNLFGQNSNAMLQQVAAANVNNLQQPGNGLGPNPNTVWQGVNPQIGNSAQLNAQNANNIVQSALIMNRGNNF